MPLECSAEIVLDKHFCIPEAAHRVGFKCEPMAFLCVKNPLSKDFSWFAEFV